MLDLSEVREDYEASSSEEQDQGDARAPSNPLARHAFEHHDNTSPAYTVPRPLVLASEYRRNLCSQCLAVTISLKFLISP